jgi:uroporphyrinogen decarboxylase
MKILNHRQRLEACIEQTSLDRPPVALWRHFPVDDQTPSGLAAATLNFQSQFDFDLVKVTPESSFCLKDWGARDAWQGAAEGTRTYTWRVIQDPEDWYKLRPLDPFSGHLGAQLECLRLICQELGETTPVLQTIFNPLSQAKNLVGGENLLVHLRRYPEAVLTGLNTIAQSTTRFIDAARQTGIAGIFFAVQHAQYGLLTMEEYLEFGKTLDLVVLQALEDLWLNILHLHGVQVMFEHFHDYPIQVINWHDRETSPSLAEGLKQFPGIVCGGLRREETMVLGSPAQVREEAQQAIEATNGRRFILGTGCVTPITAPYGNLLTARRAVERIG